jgi:hypothetical protein
MFSHPSQVCMTYLEHMKLSLELSSLFFIGSIKAFAHAFIPDIFIKSSTHIVNQAQQKMSNAGCRD